MKELFSKKRSVTGKKNKPAAEKGIPSVDTSYGKKLEIGNEEKSKLVSSLTPREWETFLLLLEGFTLRETAGQLNIGYSTANTHQTSIYRKLHVGSRAELIINYRDFGKENQNENIKL